jgi:hypothetical protein
VRNTNKLVPPFALLLLCTQPARAQLLDTLLPPAIPGYGQKFSVIAQHRRFAPGATGWNFGSLTAAPVLNAATGYDSAPGGSSGSPILQANPSLLLTDDAAGFGLYTEGDFAAYPQNHVQNTTTGLVAAGERITLPRETITISAAALHSAITGFAFDTTAIDRPIPFTLLNLRASDAITAGLFTLTPDISLSRYNVAGAASTANRTQQREAATLAYTPGGTPGGPLTALLRLSATQMNYDDPSQTADIYQAVAGLQLQQNALWTLSLLAGAAQRQPHQGSPLTTPVLEARADWQPTMLDQISLTASREIDDPDAISATPYTDTSIKLAISHQYLENVTFRTLAQLASAQYIHSDLHELLATGELDMQWQASPALAVEGMYRFNTRQANTLSAANEHVVTLGLTWTL